MSGSFKEIELHRLNDGGKCTYFIRTNFNYTGCSVPVYDEKNYTGLTKL